MVQTRQVVQRRRVPSDARSRRRLARQAKWPQMLARCPQQSEAMLLGERIDLLVEVPRDIPFEEVRVLGGTSCILPAVMARSYFLHEASQVS